MKKYRDIIIWVLIFIGGIAVRAQEPWPVAGAAARFEVRIASRPTTPAAGIVAVLPDSGILPRGKLKADVMGDAGNPLKANLLWHNPDEGLALVFEDTPAERAVIYVSSSAEYPKPAAPLRPSLMLFVRNGGTPSLEQAHALAEKMPAGPGIYFTLVERIGHTISPVGRDEQTSSYYSGWFQVQRAGKTYFYTVSKDGSEFSIDGKPVYSWPGLHTRDGGKHGEKGAWIDLAAGAHRIEYYHFAQALNGRESLLGWQQAGEPQPKNPKNPNFPNPKVTGMMTESDFVHSGSATLASAASRQGPLAVISQHWEAIVQTGQSPVCLFKFEAFGGEQLPTNTVFEWDFGGARKLKGPQAEWLYGGTGNQRVTLTISGGNGKSTCSKLFFPKSMDPAKEPPQLSINQAEDRSRVRDIFLAMCRATPAGKRPCELWNATLWEGFMGVLDAQTGYALLSELFERSHPDILNQDNTRRWLLEDAFFTALRQADQKLTAAWLDRFEKDEKDPARLGEWKARRVEFYIFEADNLAQARLAAKAFADAAKGQQQSELAMIRMGDVELFAGHQDLALRFYAQAQELGWRTTAASVPLTAAISNRPPAGAKVETKPPNGKTAGPADKKTARPPAGAATKKSANQPSDKEKLPSVSSVAADTPPAIDAWKVAAVRESSFYATVRDLIGQADYGDARKTLDQWELELPLNKLAGDFPLAEAEYYMALKQFKRARKILMTYRQSVDLSNTLPQVMKMELYCLTQLDRDKEARELGALIVKRLPNHPLAEEVKGLLTAAAEDGKLTVDVDAWSRDWTTSEKVDAAGLASLFGTNTTLGIRKKPAAQIKP
ncbi:MAG: hypothetical protein WC381_08930 [Kiritimatiellia bacterium]|jgi:hypothetical protein